MKLFKRLKLFASCLFIISISSWANLHLGLYLGYCFTWANCYALEKEKATWRLVARRCKPATAPAYLWPALHLRPTNFTYEPSSPLIVCLVSTSQWPSLQFYTHAPSTHEGFLFVWSYLKNVVSTLYYFCFENRLHQYILHDETNKTRPHLHMF